MRGVLERIRFLLREEGAAGLAGRTVALGYRRGVRPLLPTAGPVRYAGMDTARNWKWGDGRVPRRWRPHEVEDLPGYEAALLAGIEAHVRPGDRVVVVGGGVGVTAVAAALRAGPQGRVTCFEGGRQGVRLVRETATLNGVEDRVEVRHAVVGRLVSVYGTPPDHAVLAPTALQPCDVLELDCEGAEVDILTEMTIRPRVVLVETHGVRGAPTERVRALLEGLGYGVADAGVAEPRARALCEANDIHVLYGVRGDRP